MNKNRITLIVGSVVLVVGLVLVLAFIVTDGDEADQDDADAGATTQVDGSDDTDGAGGDDASGGAGESAAGSPVEATAPVVVTGAPLPALDVEVQPDPALGAVAPMVEGQSFDGSAMTIGGAGDGPRMLVFLAHWCPHCNDEIPELMELQDRGEIPDELAVVGVSTAAAPDRDNYPPGEWIEQTGWPWPVMVDSADAEAFIAFGGSGFPYTVMLDADGGVLARRAGSAPADVIGAWIADALASRPST